MKESNKTDTSMLDVLAIKKLERDIGRKLTVEETESISLGEYLFIRLPNGFMYEYKPIEIIQFCEMFSENFQKSKYTLAYLNNEKDPDYEENSEGFKKGKIYDTNNLGSPDKRQYFTYNELYVNYFKQIDEAILIHLFDSVLNEMIIRLHAEGKTSKDIKRILSALKFKHPNPRYRNKPIGKDFILDRIKDFENQHNITHVEFNK